MTVLKSFAVVFFLVCAPAGAQEIVNGGFELDLTDWETRMDGDRSLTEAAAARTGKLGLRVTDNEPRGGSSILSLPTEIQPGGKYELSCWARGVSGTGALGVYLQFLNEGGKAINKDKPVVVPAAAREWKRYALTATAPEGSVAAVVWVHSFNQDMPVIDLDDFELKTIATQ